MTQSIPNSGLKAVVVLTTRTIDLRAALFRNLVIGIVTATIIPVLWALIQLSWIPLSGLLFIVPFCVAYLCLDIRKMDQWQIQIMAAWRHGDFDLVVFSQAMSTLRTLPQGTLQGMLETLPTQVISKTGQNISDDLKAAIALTLKTINQCQLYRTAATGIAMTFGLGALASAFILWDWHPLLIWIVSIGIIAGYRCLQWLRLIRLKKYISELGNGPDKHILMEIMTKLDWGAICEKRKTRWMATV